MASTTNETTQAPSPEDLKLYALQQKYTEEAAKRFRPEGPAQFVDLKDASEDRFRSLGEDPWADHAALNAKQTVKDGGRYKFVILGAGYGGLVFAVRLIEAGLASGPDGLRIIDNAGGFGGTWYWNRYPGLHCDIESYTYMPLLEETGYVPKFKYAPGPELREYADRIATQWHLHEKALFRSRVTTARWDDDKQLWDLKVIEGRGPGQERKEVQLWAEYFLTASGIFPTPHIPKITGLHTFGGSMFHTSRWDYSITGGTPEDPRLTGLEGKRVGILGTGATAVQAVPYLGKWAKELYVFQRTPSNVWPRGQRPTNLDEWKTKVAHKKGWQLERMANLNSYLTNSPIEDQPNMVNDGWTEMPAFCAGVGSPKWGIIDPTPEKIQEHVGRLLKLDIPHTEAGRAWVDEIVKDPETAAKLKAWYPTWCKRPTWNDDYLRTFNLPQVHLVDTDGKGIESVTDKGLVVAGKEYPLDILILSTGFQGPIEGNLSPAVRTGVDIYGRRGRSLDEKWQNHGPSTLHGAASNGFPNLFFQNPSQTASAANYVYSVEVWVRHMVGIIAAAEKRAGAGSRAVVEVSSAAEEVWGGEIMRHAAYFASLAGCTPGYLNGEGAFGRMPTDQAEMMKKAKMGTWSQGMESFAKFLEEYRAEGSFQGINITSVTVA